MGRLTTHKRKVEGEEVDVEFLTITGRIKEQYKLGLVIRMMMSNSSPSFMCVVCGREW